MKRKITQNSNGISISDSIIMSVKQKHSNIRKPFSIAIAVMGFISVIMSFLGMFPIHFHTKTVIFSGIVLIGFYAALASIAGKALWGYTASVIVFLLAAYKRLSKLILGYKYIYNVIYKISFESKINYYKDLKPALELSSVTTFIIFYMWLLAIVLCFFTICRPNPVLPILITFPLIEIGLYNGVNVPVFWGILCIAYWLAVLSMSTIDVGEYSGGQSGFVRKNNLFFPKRHMKLKVTEKCGIMVICSVMLTALTALSVMKLTGYERSDKINQKRRDISDAVEDFSFSDFAESMARLSKAFGVNFEYESHKLGTTSKIRYKNVTDLTIKLDKPLKGALYLKGDVDAVYRNNQWIDLETSAYPDKMLDNYKKYNIYPQDFTLASYNMTIDDPTYNHIQIKPRGKITTSYVPYYTLNDGHISYVDDALIIPKNQPKDDNSYLFCSDEILKRIQMMSPSVYVTNRSVFSLDDFQDSDFKRRFEDYCIANGLIDANGFISVDSSDIFDTDKVMSDPNNLLTVLMQQKYREFVYSTYLDVPDTKAMQEVREKFADLIQDKDISTPANELKVLDAIREKIMSTSKYTLSPGKTPSSWDFVNYFLLESHKGFCAHYATSGVILARMAGIPARYATGYIVTEKDLSSGKSNPDGSLTVNVKDNRKHAWAEIYLDQIGWVPYEFTSGYSSTDIPTPPPVSDTTTSSTAPTQTSTVTTETTSSVSTSVSNQTTQITSYVTTTSKGGGTTISKHSDPGKPVGSKFVRYVIQTLKEVLKLIFFAAVIICVLLLRRYMILRIRNRKLTTGKASSRVINSYLYAEKILSELKLNSKRSNYVQFASDVEKWHGDIYFDNGNFEFLTDTALKTKFGNISPTGEEVEKCLEIVKQMSERLYDKSGHLKKLKLKYLKVLI